MNLAGSTTGLTNGAGAPVKTYAYDVFGAVRSTGIDQADTDFRFTGEQQDADVSGLYYLRARYYDPALGRFWTQDYAPAGASDPQALNDYAYVRNNPARLVDPSGLWCPRNPEDCIPGPVEDAAGDAWDVVTDTWDDVSSGPWTYTKIIQILDVLPVAEACFVGGAVATIWTGGGAAVVGVGAYAACNMLVEPVIGALAAEATQVQIWNAGCSKRRWGAATALNLANVGLDAPFRLPFVDDLGDAAAYVAGNKILDRCGKE